MWAAHRAQQAPLGQAADRVAQKDGTEVWVKTLKDGSKALGLFNRSDKEASVSVDWTAVGLSGPQKLRDLRLHKDLGTSSDSFSTAVPPHGVVLLSAKP